MSCAVVTVADLMYSRVLTFLDHTLRTARTRLRNARTQAQGAYMRYTQALDSERIAEQEVVRSEERLHELCTWLSFFSS